MRVFSLTIGYISRTVQQFRPLTDNWQELQWCSRHCCGGVLISLSDIKDVSTQRKRLESVKMDYFRLTTYWVSDFCRRSHLISLLPETGLSMDCAISLTCPVVSHSYAVEPYPRLDTFSRAPFCHIASFVCYALLEILPDELVCFFQGVLQ